ncbi:MAG: hypothetical protein ACI4TM_11225 [Candidatus Cryptobacteroides sp.]
MIDVSNLNSLITALRAETAKDAISPDSLGSLLQKITDVIASAAKDSDVSDITNWKSLLSAISSCVTAIQQNLSDRNNIYLDLDTASLASGARQSLSGAVCIKQATTERAGAMRAQQVIDLNGCKSDIKSLQSSISSLQTSISELQSTDTSLSNRIASVENEQPYPFRLRILEGKLYIHDLDENIKNSCQPFIFRWVKKRPHYKVEENNFYGMRRKGWNVWRGCDVAKLDTNGMLQIEHNDMFTHNPNALFCKPNAIYGKDGSLNDVRIGFGSKSYSLSTSKKFSFAIGFAPQSAFHEREGFKFKSLKTPLVKFHVFVNKQEFASDTVTAHFCL